MTRFPTLFLSHGAPTLAIDGSPAHHFLRELGSRLGAPAGIVVFSAHHDARPVTVTSSAAPRTWHDFGGFSPSLNAIRYPAPGDPRLASNIVSRLERAGIPAKQDASRGLDHGAWVPLHLMYPAGAVPVVQVAIDARRDTQWHEAQGSVLAPLREDGVLLIGSGSATHDLGSFFGAPQPLDAAAPEWVTAFSEWLAVKLEAGDRDAVRHAVTQGPFGRRNHPTPEHLLPLYVALGAAGDAARAKRLHHSTAHAVLAMDMYAFGAPEHLLTA
ncbi:MAG: class III extradiol ring-cleavage dioxygenase [Pseudomonadota bacterium]